MKTELSNVTTELVPRRKALEPTSIDKISPEHKYRISDASNMRDVYEVQKERVREGFFASLWRKQVLGSDLTPPFDCLHKSQRFINGKWFCRDCGERMFA